MLTLSRTYTCPERNKQVWKVPEVSNGRRRLSKLDWKAQFQIKKKSTSETKLEIRKWRCLSKLSFSISVRAPLRPLSYLDPPPEELSREIFLTSSGFSLNFVNISAFYGRTHTHTRVVDNE